MLKMMIEPDRIVAENLLATSSVAESLSLLLFFIVCLCTPFSLSARSWDSAGSAGANHLPEFMSGDVPDKPDRAGGHPV